MKKVLKYCILLLFAVFGVLAQDIAVSPLKRQVRIDGKLDEAAWQAAPSVSGFQFLAGRNPGRKPQADTAFKVLADRENIYLGIRCGEPDMSKLRANIKEYDTNPWRDDVVEIFFSPDGMPAQFYQFVVTAGGAAWQMYYEEKGVTRPDPYFPVYEVKVFHGPDFWSAELRIPLRAFYPTRNQYWKDTWLFNVARCRTQGNEWTSWSKLQNSFHESERFGRLGGMPKRSAEQDIFIRGASFAAKSAKGGRITGDLTVEVSGGNGKYMLGGGFKERQVELRPGENHIAVPDMNFDGTGRQQLSLALRSGDGKIAAERFYPVNVSLRTLALEFSAPGYGGCFFPGQDAARLKGEIVSAAGGPEMTLEVDGKEHKIKPSNGKYLFDIDISGVGKDEFEVVAGGGGDRATAVIRKLKPSGKTTVWLENGHPVINGEPVFALGWYGVGWCSSTWNREKYPNPSAKHPYNFYGQVGLEPMRLVKGIEAREATRDVRPSQELFDKIKERIEANRNRDFMYYYLCDEPECRGVSPVYLKYLYDYVKELDPYHPVMIISRAPELYLDCSDIISPHPYLNPLIDDKGKRTLRLTVENVRDMCRKVARANRPDKVLMLTPQTFSYAFNNAYADFTTFDETNASVWSSVCQGARGLLPYIWYDHMSTPDLDLGCDFIFQSLDRLAGLLTSSKARELNVSNPKVDGQLLEGLLILVNVTPQKQPVKVSAGALAGYSSLYRFREDESVTLSDGAFSFEMAPYQVLVLTGEKQDEGLATLPETRAKIAAAEKARNSRGNILFGKGRDIELSFPPSAPYDLINAMEQQVKLFDGILDGGGWLPRNVKGGLWYELAFPKFVPKFSKARIYGHNLSGTSFKIKKFGEWQEPQATAKSDKYCLELDFGKTLSTICIRLDFPEKNVELYEIELLK